MAQQMGLFGAEPKVFVDDETGRIVHFPAIFTPSESTELFARLEHSLAWSKETMWMYDRTVDVPRLIARFGPGEELPPELRSVRARAEEVLQTRFTSVSAQYYRDGNDSVAWHNDHREELIALPTIALLSLGATREMQLRSKARPRRMFSCDLDAGTVFVMSGRSQEFWEHHIPKVARAVGPRISVALRQSVQAKR